MGNPFQPTVGGTKVLAATAVSGSTPFASQDVLSPVNNSGHGVIRVYNAGPGVAFVRWGVGPQIATAADLPLIPGVVELFGKSYSDDTFAAIVPGSTATIYVTGGSGE